MQLAIFPKSFFNKVVTYFSTYRDQQDEDSCQPEKKQTYFYICTYIFQFFAHIKKETEFLTPNKRFFRRKNGHDTIKSVKI